ncbi:MAG: hypothetical protein ACRDHW_21415, partial [Ktedonobacteraceae bacterium]
SGKKGNSFMNKSTLFLGGILLCIVGIALGIFFLIPGIPHIITTSAAHGKHATAAFVLAALCLIVALVNRPKAA